MKLSIIIVNWNTRDLLLQAVGSVMDYPRDFSYEVIVVDNHSQDQSVSTLKRAYPQAIVIENDRNLGFAKANNQALEIAKGEYVLLLNSDTIVREGALEALVSYCDKHPEIMMAGPKLLNEDGSFQFASRRNLPNPSRAIRYFLGLDRKKTSSSSYKRFDDDPDQTEYVEAISGAAMMFRREVYESLGGLDESFFMYGEDLDFCKRVGDRGWKIAYVAEARIVHLGGEASKQRKIKSLWVFYASMWTYYKKHLAVRHGWFFNVFVWAGIAFFFLVAFLRGLISLRFVLGGKRK